MASVHNVSTEAPPSKEEVQRRINIMVVIVVVLCAFYLYRYGFSIGLQDQYQLVLLAVILGMVPALLYLHLKHR